MRSGQNRRSINEEEKRNAFTMITSMLFSLFLVALSVLFIIGFRAFLKNHPYQGKAKTETAQAGKGDILVVDPSFDVTYIIIKNIKDKEKFCRTAHPGVVDEESVPLKNGQMLQVRQKGAFKDKLYYRLKDNTYVEADETKVQEVKEYIPLSGYIAITYISSGGVRLRSWIDFDADNVARSVYVGDKVTVTAMVTIMEGTSAFRTSDGLFITTNPQYFTDYTNLSEVEAAERSTSDIPETEETTEE